jgi:hypothetical protein
MCITQDCAKADQAVVQKMWRDVEQLFELLVAPKQHFVTELQLTSGSNLYSAF